MEHISTAPRYTKKEEVANSITHGLGTGLSIAGLVVLVVLGAIRGTVWHVVSYAVFGASMIILYLASTLYHSIPWPGVKAVLQKFDHASIFILIAGTYTPYMLVTLRGPLGWSLFGVIWGLAIFGIIFKMIFIHKFPVLSTVLYVLMGWICIVAIKQLYYLLPLNSLVLLIAGGISYTAGVVFYAWRSLPYSHSIWHLFVLGGTICHYFSILFAL